MSKQHPVCDRRRQSHMGFESLSPREQLRGMHTQIIQQRSRPANVTGRKSFTRSKSLTAGQKEAAFISRAVIIMVLLAVRPLITFHIVNYLYPELFLVPITPTEWE